MDIGIWPSAFNAHFFAAAAQTPDINVIPIQRSTAIEAVLKDEVPIALVETIDVLRHHDDIEIFPFSALAFWRLPFVSLLLKRGFEEPIRRVGLPEASEQIEIFAKIVLGEHYGAHPQFETQDVPTVEQADSLNLDAWITRSEKIEPVNQHLVHLDLGQEWYELTNYPVVWGLFVTKKGFDHAPALPTMSSFASAAEELRLRSLEAETIPEALKDFFIDDLRLLLDDVTLAGLIEIQVQLYYHEAVAEIVELPWINAQEQDDEQSSAAE